MYEFIKCTHKELPLNVGLVPYYKSWGWTLEKAIEDYKRRSGKDPVTVYEIDTEYLINQPEKEAK